MQQVEGFAAGERDYLKLEGDTGPLVYPAGFLYVYWALHAVTARGADVRTAQYIFLGLYLLSLAVVMAIARRARALPPWGLVLLCCSRRLHSIFMLRLFNDCWAMLLLFLAVYAFTRDRWSLGCLLFSAGVSIKMNVLLFAPGLLLLLVERFGLLGALPKLALCAALQVAVGVPFLLTFPQSYLGRAFEFGREFKFVWTVNWRFLPVDVFRSREFALALLGGHLLVLFAFAHWRWCGAEGAFRFLLKRLTRGVGGAPLAPERVAQVLFTCNFVGIVFARSLHYQFYSWYFFTLPPLLFWADASLFVGALALVTIELAWNAFPASPLSSALLLVAHLYLLGALFAGPAPPPPAAPGDAAARAAKKLR